MTEHAQPPPGIPRPSSAASDPSGTTSRLVDILPHVFSADPAALAACLFSGNTAVHHAACRYLYRELHVNVPVAGTMGQSPLHQAPAADGTTCCPGRSDVGKLLALLRHPANATYVRVLRFAHPCPSHTPANISDVTRTADRLEAWAFAASLIEQFTDIEELVWETGFGLNSSMCKAISTLPKLRRLSICYPPPHPGHVAPPGPVYPRITIDPQVAILSDFDLPPLDEEVHSDRGSVPRAIGLGGHALGIAWEDVEELRLEGLSGPGARSFGSHLQILSQLDYPQQPRLHTLTLSTHFLDTRLCESIAAFGALRSLRHLSLGTSGLKFTADCLRTLIEECTVLESLHLNDVEGRLGKNPWGQINHWPSTFKVLEVDVSEVGAHHSWVLDHLGSISEVPFRQLSTFSVRRLVPPVALLPFPPPTVAVPPRLPTHAPEPILDDLLEALCEEGCGLERLCLDWWELLPSELERLVTSCPHLRELQVAVKAPMVDIISLSNAFGHTPLLTELSITSEPKYNTTAPKGKVKKRKETKQDEPLPPYLAEKMAEAEADCAMLDPRDLRKLLRRLPSFRVFRWIGRGGKGEWRVGQSAKKTSTLIPIRFVPSICLTRQTWVDCQRTPPSFEFDDEVVSTKVLELPPSPDRHSPTELPTLSRTTTGSSTSLMTAATPPSTGLLGPVPTVARRASATSMPNTTVLGIDWESSTYPSISTSPWARSPTTGTAPRRMSDTRLEMRTGKLEIKTSRERERDGHNVNQKDRRASRNGSRSPTKSVSASPTKSALISPAKTSPSNGFPGLPTKSLASGQPQSDSHGQSLSVSPTKNGSVCAGTRGVRGPRHGNTVASPSSTEAARYVPGFGNTSPKKGPAPLPAVPRKEAAAPAPELERPASDNGGWTTVGERGRK